MAVAVMETRTMREVPSPTLESELNLGAQTKIARPRLGVGHLGDKWTSDKVRQSIFYKFNLWSQEVTRR
jgi:hypothetical protein